MGDVLKNRDYNIDIIKALAIISVILLHTLSWQHRYLIGGPFHIWQAVPVFMLMVGYNFAFSTQAKGHTQLNELYQWPVIKRRLKRIILPFLMFAGGRLILQLMLKNRMNWSGYFKGFLLGGFANGGYYIPIMLQAILIVPFLYYLIYKKPHRSAGFLLVLFLFLDWFSMFLGIPGGVYRVLIIRYLFVLVIGIWLGLRDGEVELNKLIPLTLLSLVYIASVYYFGLRTTLETHWQAQHGPAYFWTLFIVVVLLNFKNIKPDNILTKFFVKIGQSSYYIFLTQMLYFWLVNHFDFYPGVWAEVPINLLICIASGLLFEKVYGNLIN